MRRIAIGAVVVVRGGRPGGADAGLQGPQSRGTSTGSSSTTSSAWSPGLTSRWRACRSALSRRSTCAQLDSAAHCQNPLHGVVTVSINQAGFGQFHQYVTCAVTAPVADRRVLRRLRAGNAGAGSPGYGTTIQANHTQSTIPADLVPDVLRLPYRQRFTILINELGAAVAARSEDLQTALRRADPALAETDNLLNLLANDAHIDSAAQRERRLRDHRAGQRHTDVQRFVVQANNASTASAVQAANIQATWEKLPGLPGAAAAGSTEARRRGRRPGPGAGQPEASALQPQSLLHRPGPVLARVGPVASVARQGLADRDPRGPGGNAHRRAPQPVREAHVPELAQNLAIVLHDLDSRSRAVERDPRSPAGGAGYTGLEALLEYVFNVTLAVNYFGQYGSPPWVSTRWPTRRAPPTPRRRRSPTTSRAT